jgi:hypothetical protein
MVEHDIFARPMICRLAYRALGLLLIGFGLSAAPEAHPAAASETGWHGPGIAYFCDFNPQIPLAVHVVKIDRAQKDLELHTTLGGGNQIGMAVLSDQVRFINPQIGQAVAAINGDYFNVWRPFIGDPKNLQIFRGGELVSSPGEDRAFFYLDAKGEPHITNVVDKFAIIWPNGKTTPLGLNQTPMTGQAILYTTAAGPSTRVDGLDLILGRNGQDPWLPLRIGQTLTAKVRQINKDGYSKLTPDCAVLSLSPRSLDQLPPLTPGMVLKISTATVPDISGTILAIGGGPSLVREGKVREAREVRGFQMRHPRSAFGWNDKYYYFFQYDGRQARYSMGMTLLELSEYFVKLKCDYAINLDGGGSCTTWVAGKIVNSPSQGGERASANALVVVRKAKATN